MRSQGHGDVNERKEGSIGTSDEGVKVDLK